LLAGLVALFIIGLLSLYFTMDKLNKVYEIPLFSDQRLF